MVRVRMLLGRPSWVFSLFFLSILESHNGCLINLFDTYLPSLPRQTSYQIPYTIFTIRPRPACLLYISILLPSSLALSLYHKGSDFSEKSSSTSQLPQRALFGGRSKRLLFHLSVFQELQWDMYYYTWTDIPVYRFYLEALYRYF